MDSADFQLTNDERQYLLEYARRAVASALQRTPIPPGEEGGALAERCGVFVTWRLRSDGALRGCIGVLEATASLVSNVGRMAVAAALEDPRFSPVTEPELASLRAEVSVLSPLSSIRPEDVEVGRHGLMIRRGPRRGLLLPQVSAEQRWDREAFLEGVCRKAGLPSGAWRDRDADLQGFTAVVFGEDGD